MDKVEKIIVPTQPRDKAAEAFRKWQLNNPTIWSRLDETDVIIDLICTRGSEAHARYRVLLRPSDAAALQSVEGEPDER